MAANPNQVSSASVLVVDDDKTIRAIVEATLIGEGYAVTTSSDFDQATDLAKNAQPPFDAIVQDNSMPPRSGCIIEMAQVLEREQIPSGLVGFTSDPNTVINGIKQALASKQLLRPHDVVAKGPGALQNIKAAVARATGMQP